jgi:hypothetical protein
MKKTCIKMESSIRNPIDLLQIHQPNTESFRPSAPQKHGSEKTEERNTHPINPSYGSRLQAPSNLRGGGAGQEVHDGSVGGGEGACG